MVEEIVPKIIKNFRYKDIMLEISSIHSIKVLICRFFVEINEWGKVISIVKNITNNLNMGVATNKTNGIPGVSKKKISSINFEDIEFVY